MLNDTIFLFLQNDKNRPRRRYQEEVWLLLVPNTCPNSQFLLVLLLRVSLGKHAPRLPMDSCTFPHLREGHLSQICAGSCQKINGWGWQPNGTTEQIPGNPILVYETRSLWVPLLVVLQLQHLLYASWVLTLSKLCYLDGEL